MGGVFGFIDSSWTGSTYGLCWGDDRGGSRQLYFKSVTPTGVDVVADMAVTTDFDAVYTCSIAWTGSEFVIGWAGRKSTGVRGGYLAAVGADGTKRTTDVFLETIEDSSPRRPVWVEYADGYGLGVAWARSMSGDQDVVVQRYDLDLVAVGDPVVVSDGTADAQSPELAWDGSAFGVAWERQTDVYDSDVYFSRVGCP
jgi:hypothetical protein